MLKYFINHKEVTKEEAIEAAKLRAKLHALIDEAKTQGLISDEEI